MEERSGTLSPSRSYGNESSWKLENPFSFRAFQIFTGAGVGCGIGIGVGKPIYMGSIPAFQQVLSATQGAMDVFSTAGRHVNSNLRRVGVKNIEAGIGCGVGFGHGFGVGITLKPGAAHKLQTFIGSLIGTITKKIGPIPGLPVLEEPIRSPNSSGNSRTSSTSVLQMTTESAKVPPSSTSKDEMPTMSSSEASIGTRTEKVIKSFLDSPIFENDEQPDVDEMVKKLKSENNVLQLLLNHQRIIDQLIKENETLRQILIEDFKVSPSKLRRDHGNNSESIERLRGRKRWVK